MGFGFRNSGGGVVLGGRVLEAPNGRTEGFLRVLRIVQLRTCNLCIFGSNLGRTDKSLDVHHAYPCKLAW